MLLVRIVGRGGLLGLRIAAAIPQYLPEAFCWNCPVAKFSWGEPALAEQLELVAAEFARTVHANGQPWIVIWAAGAGVIGTAQAALETGNAVVANSCSPFWIGTWAAVTERLPGFSFHSSSAGGVFGNCPDQPITEASPCQPISLYGRNKLRQETLIHAWIDAHPGTSCLIGRIANLYGPGQNLAKPQGLISASFPLSDLAAAGTHLRAAGYDPRLSVCR